MYVATRRITTAGLSAGEQICGRTRMPTFARRTAEIDLFDKSFKRPRSNTARAITFLMRRITPDRRRFGAHLLDHPLDIRPPDCRKSPRLLFRRRRSRPDLIIFAHTSPWDIMVRGAFPPQSISPMAVRMRQPSGKSRRPPRTLRTPGPAFQVGRRERDAAASCPDPLQYSYPACQSMRRPASAVQTQSAATQRGGRPVRSPDRILIGSTRWRRSPSRLRRLAGRRRRREDRVRSSSILRDVR